MYTELSCYEADAREGDIIQAVFGAVEKRVSGFSVLPHHLSAIKNLLPEGFVLSCGIDYPGGTSLPEVKAHAIISAIRRGANAIDLVINHSLIVDRKFEKIRQELETAYNICKEKNASLRIILEYKLYDALSLLYAVCDIIAEIGIEYVYVSSGLLPCDILDSIIVGNAVQKRGLNVIYNTNIWLPKHLEDIKNSGIFGIRFKTIHTINNTFGVL